MKLDWDQIFFNDLSWLLAGEIVIRTLIMFVTIIVFIRLSGKKGVRQLSLFEVAVIIGLGSAAGDPMFNKGNAIIPAVIVFICILGIYRLLTWLASKYERFESVLEGNPVYIIEDGEFVLIKDSEPMFAKDEFLAEMRQKNIEHLGQVKTAILETTGNISFFFYPDADVKQGLPILPKVYNKKNVEIYSPGNYACTYCGHVEEIKASCCCSRCNKNEWVGAIKTLRLT